MSANNKDRQKVKSIIKENMRIVFMGTPDFAVASLEAIIEAGNEVVAVVTSPDKPAGRGQKIHTSAVKQFALESNIPILQPTNLKNPDFLDTLKSYQADLQIVVAFRMLPEVVWNMPQNGTVNLHASLLPHYRGAAPINHAIINGESKSGVTTFLLQHEIDTGHMLFQEEVDIEETDDAGILHDKLMATGAELLVKTIQAISDNNINPTPQSSVQPEELLQIAPKIFKEDCKINWENNTDKIYNVIRGLSPYPTAFTYLDGKVLKIYKSEKEIVAHTHKAGDVLSDNKTTLKYATLDGYINLLSIQIEGKKRMNITDFLRGYRFESPIEFLHTV